MLRNLFIWAARIFYYAGLVLAIPFMLLAGAVVLVMTFIATPYYLWSWCAWLNGDEHADGWREFPVTEWLNDCWGRQLTTKSNATYKDENDT